jgi:cytochrome P450
MGRDFDSLNDESNKLNQMYRSLFNQNRSGIILLIASVFLPPWVLQKLPTKRNGEFSDASLYIKDLCRDLIAKKKAAMAEKTHVEKDIISVALESGGFSDEDLVNQMMTFLIAGHETTATAMIWAIYLLCKHPEVQKKLREEVRSNLPSLDDDITAADIDNCSYLQAVCNEIMRVHPPVTLTLRVAACDTSINGQFIPKDTPVILAPAGINTSTHLWGPDAQEFKPERWLDNDGKANNKGGADSNYSFLTFLHGPRSCIGQKFAQAEFACLLAGWIGRLETEFEEGSPLIDEDPDIQGGVTSKPRGGVWVRVRQLDGW